MHLLQNIRTLYYILFSSITNHLNAYNVIKSSYIDGYFDIICKEQHGFQICRSCETQPLDAVNANIQTDLLTRFLKYIYVIWCLITIYYPNYPTTVAMVKYLIGLKIFCLKGKSKSFLEIHRAYLVVCYLAFPKALSCILSCS